MDFDAYKHKKKRQSDWSKLLDILDANTSLNLDHLSLEKCNMRFFDLKNASLTHSDFFRTDLTGANLSGADLRWCQFREADLTGANLSGANLSFASFIGANIADVMWDDAIIYETNFPLNDNPQIITTSTHICEEITELQRRVTALEKEYEYIQCDCGSNKNESEWYTQPENGEYEYVAVNNLEGRAIMRRPCAEDNNESLADWLGNYSKQTNLEA